MWLAAVVLLPLARAHAEPAPPTMPTRDVDVTYRTPRPGAGAGATAPEQRMRWAAGEGKLRVDPPSPGLHVIMDYRAHRLETIRDAERTVLEMDASGAGIGPGAAASGRSFTRRGEAEVAGLSCTQWETRDTSGQPATVCLTADGVLLRAVGAGRVLVEATKVVYGAIDPAAFRIPDGYTRVEAPPPGGVPPKAPQ